MNVINAKFLTSVATILTLGLLCLVPRDLAQSNCKHAKGNFVESFDGVSTTTGTLTNAGWLDGTTVAVFNSRAYPTRSTGIFEGATGVLFLNLIKSTTVAVGPYYEVVGGQICFANGNEPPEE